MDRTSASSRRVIAALLAAAIAAVGVTSQIHFHWQAADRSLKIAAECGHPEPVSPHTCLACKVSHRSLSPPSEDGTNCEPPLRAVANLRPPEEAARSASYSPAAPRAPPSTFHS